MFYVGTSCLPEERKGYVILSASSADGLNFVKREQPIISNSEEWSKTYSPRVVKIGDKYHMYFAVSANGNYVIKRAVSDDLTSFQVVEGTVIGVGEGHINAVHTPKVLQTDQGFNCYYTGSDDGQKIFSQKYPIHDFGNRFRLFLAVSEDGLEFKRLRRIDSIERDGFLNYYGHNVVNFNGETHLFFTAFDGSINRIYASRSADGQHFSEPSLLLQPDEAAGEVGTYSCTLAPIGFGEFRMYYGVRYLDNHWTINSATFNISNLSG